MSYVVISSFENVDTGDLQAQGEAIVVFAAETPARAHFTSRVSHLAAAADEAHKSENSATFIVWIVLLKMPLEVATVEEVLEDLELVIEETESIDDPLGELVVAYEGQRHSPAGTTDYEQKEALQALEAWLT